jgi:toxin ParE1/3/4
LTSTRLGRKLASAWRRRQEIRPAPVELVWTRKAREDLIEIFTYIGIDNPPAAERVFDAIQTKAELLITHPRIGVRRPDIRSSARMLVEGSYLVLYETDPDTDKEPIQQVEIVRIVDGRRNLKNIL